MLCLWKGQFLICEKKTPWFYPKKKMCNWYLFKFLSFWFATYFYVWLGCFSTDRRHSYGHQLCWLVPIFVPEKRHTGVSQDKRKKAVRFFNFSFRYIDVLSLNKFNDFVGRVYSIQLEIMDSTYTARSASYLDIDTVRSVSYFDIYLQIYLK